MSSNVEIGINFEYLFSFLFSGVSKKEQIAVQVL
jgi:hypothetical protein